MDEERIMELERSEEVSGMMPASDGINVVRWFALESERSRRETIQRHRTERERRITRIQNIRMAMVLGGLLGILGGAGTAEIGDLRIGVITMAVAFVICVIGVVWEVFA